MLSSRGIQESPKRADHLIEMITKAIIKVISKMASGKAAGPSGIVAKMLKHVGEAGAVEEHEDII